ncbi:unnamed protein product [Caenorhabditis angaria]|uniref:Uncharacterized protein n=1 Tax=Caenorhabditis angaria TaxID=860376 RepID=A0A9P1J3B1_9PELO|nr:unnamed protein product [Caenorhabditis angaria]
MPQKSSLSCIQIITPRSSPTPTSTIFFPPPSYLSSSEFDPVLYREELLRKSYLSKFPIDSYDRPDYLVTIGKARRPCSTITLEVKGRDEKPPKSQLSVKFIIFSCLIIIIFLTMFYIYISGFVQFLE